MRGDSQSEERHRTLTLFLSLGFNYSVTDTFTGSAVSSLDLLPSDIYHSENVSSLSFFAADLPPMGFKTYLIQKVTQSQEFGSFGEISLRQNVSSISNEFFEVSFDQLTNRITSVLIKLSGT